MFVGSKFAEVLLTDCVVGMASERNDFDGFKSHA